MKVEECRLCPRLVEWREKVAREKRRSFAQDVYWGRPVPDFGDPAADLLIVGLAPAAHGANRTGRMFTGDRSGDWLFRAMHRAGLANQAMAVSIDDGLQLHGVLITPLAHCAPPDNKPTPEELQHCSRWLIPVLQQREWRGILCLGGLSWMAVQRHLGLSPAKKFSHGAERQVSEQTRLLASYHPSQQNTFTGRLTEAMLDEVMVRFRDLRRDPSPNLPALEAADKG